ncbi:unnamed protein product, partial [Prorocentrum cordatum]
AGPEHAAMLKFFREPRDDTALPWAVHKWKQAPEVHVVAEVVWLYRAVLEDVMLRNTADGEGLAAKDEKAKRARSPAMIEPKWVPFKEESSDPLKLALVVGNLTTSEAAEGGKSALKLGDVTGALGVFETVGESILGDSDKPEE